MMASSNPFFIAAMDTSDRPSDFDAIQRMIRKARVQRDAATAQWIGELVAAAARRIARIAGPTFRRARPADLPEIVDLVNAANSGDGDGTAGWTHELELFHGNRTDIAEVRGLFAAPGAMFVLWLERGEVGGSAYLKPTGTSAYMGLLAVRPTLQGRGVGSALIAECERIAREEMGCTKLAITVITTHRPELTAFYRRRGYVRTGVTKAFERKQVARIEGLRPEWMEKDLSAHSRLQRLLKGFSSWLHLPRATRAPASAGQYSSR
jgi:GNAT superfamily N-acetyltransferase